MKIYIEPRDWWIGYYRGDTYHYVCPFPTVVVRWRRKLNRLPCGHPGITPSGQFPIGYVHICTVCGRALQVTRQGGWKNPTGGPEIPKVGPWRELDEWPDWVHGAIKGCSLPEGHAGPCSIPIEPDVAAGTGSDQ